MNSAALSILRHSGAVRTYVYIIADLRVSFKYGNPAFLRFLRFFRLNRRQLRICAFWGRLDISPRQTFSRSFPTSPGGPVRTDFLLT